MPASGVFSGLRTNLILILRKLHMLMQKTNKGLRILNFACSWLFSCDRVISVAVEGLNPYVCTCTMVTKSTTYMIPSIHKTTVQQKDQKNGIQLLA